MEVSEIQRRVREVQYRKSQGIVKGVTINRFFDIATRAEALKRYKYTVFRMAVLRPPTHSAQYSTDWHTTSYYLGPRTEVEYTQQEGWKIIRKDGVTSYTPRSIYDPGAIILFKSMPDGVGYEIGHILEEFKQEAAFVIDQSSYPQHYGKKNRNKSRRTCRVKFSEQTPHRGIPPGPELVYSSRALYVSILIPWSALSVY